MLYKQVNYLELEQIMRITTRVTPALVQYVHEAIGADLGFIKQVLERLERQEEQSPHMLVRQIQTLSGGYSDEHGTETIRRVLARGHGGAVGSDSDFIIFIRDLILEAEEHGQILTKMEVKTKWDERLRRYQEAEHSAYNAAAQLELSRVTNLI